MALGDVYHPATPSGILAESLHGWLATLSSSARHATHLGGHWKSLVGQQQIPVTQAGCCMALGFALGWVGPWQCGAVIWVDGL